MMKHYSETEKKKVENFAERASENSFESRERKKAPPFNFLKLRNIASIGRLCFWERPSIKATNGSDGTFKSTHGHCEILTNSRLLLRHLEERKGKKKF